MKRIILAVTALILMFAPCACNSGGNPGATPTPGSPARAATNEPAQSEDERGDIIDDETKDDGRGDVITPHIQGDPGETEVAEWWGAFAGQGCNSEYLLTITEVLANDFWFEVSRASDDSVIFAGTANINANDSHKASYEEETVLSFVLSDSGDTIELSAEDERLVGIYGIVNHADRYDLGGRGDTIGSDPGDTDAPNWWGEFKGEEFSVAFTNFDGTSFWFTFYNLRNGQAFFEGAAALYPDNEFMAEHGDISFYLYEDFNAVDLFAPESSEWAHLRGQYEQIDRQNES